MENQLVKVINESGLDKTKAQVLLENFSNYFEIASEWETKLNSITVTDVSQVAEMKMAGEARKFLKNKRIDVENTRKQLKEQSLREGQTIDSIARILKNLIEPLEEKAEKIEKFKELKEAEERAMKTAERIEQLIPYNIAIDAKFIEIMTDESFNSYLTGLKIEKEQKEEAERKAELERIEKERKNKLRIERRELALPFFQFWTDFEKELDFAEVSENDFNSFMERNKKAKSDFDIQQEQIRLQNQKLEAEKKAAEEKARKEKEVAEKKLKEQQEIARKEAEKAAKEKAELEAKIKAQKEAEEKAKREADEKAELERKAKEAAEKAPDKEKLSIWVNSFSLGNIPNVSEKVMPARQIIEQKFEAFKNWAIEQIKNV